MNNKIELYREVLEIEPGSRVFFPLAKLLVQSNQPTEALTVLRQGLLRHPDHIEARFLLIELLATIEKYKDIQQELETISHLFGQYPLFWKEWSKSLAANPSTHDAAFAVQFFTAALQGQTISWAKVIENGLAATLQVIDEPLPQAITIKETEAPCIETHETAHDMDDSEEEPFSLRTRSMADILAEQGDFANALDIYNELLEAAPANQKNELQLQIDELTAKFTSSPAVQPGVQAPATGMPEGENTRLVTLLESLAHRLESRAR